MRLSWWKEVFIKKKLKLGFTIKYACPWDMYPHLFGINKICKEGKV